MESNHRSPGCHPGVIAAGPRDRVSDRSESRTHKFTRLSTSSLYQFAYPAVAGSGVAPDELGLWGPAEHWLTCVMFESVTKGRVELPRRVRHDVLNVGCLPVPSLGRVCSAFS